MKRVARWGFASRLSLVTEYFKKGVDSNVQNCLEPVVRLVP